MEHKYKSPGNLPEELKNEICKKNFKINDDLIKIFYNHLIKISGVDKDILTFEDLDNEKIKELKKRIIEWRMFHYCDVVNNALKNNHDLIMTNDLSHEINVYTDFYKSIKIFDSVTKKEISRFLQPRFRDHEDIYTNINSPWCFEAYEKIINAVNEFKNFLSNKVFVTLRFKNSDDGSIKGYYYDETNRKELHELRQLNDMTKSITGLECDPRTRAVSWYKEYFCKKKLEIIVKDRQLFIYSDTKEEIPEHLQPKHELSKENGDTIYICVIPNKMNDPRIDAIKMYNKKVDDKNNLLHKTKDEILKDPTKYNKYRNLFFKKKRSSRDNKKIFKCVSP